MELRDKHVVVTGGSSGIGRALVKRFAQDQPRGLVVADIDEVAARRVADEIGAMAVGTDVSREEDIERLIQRAEQANGPIDVFFSNAGIAGPGGGPESADEEWQRTWEVNVMAHVWAARLLLPGMLERGGGYLLSTASAAGLLTQVSALAYSATKHAAVAVAEWISINYADSGIKVSCLCPQGVRTPMVEMAIEQDPVGSQVLLAEGLLEPEEVAEAVIDAMREERFLILPHPRVADFMALRGGQHERWMAGMRKLVRQAPG